MQIFCKHFTKPNAPERHVSCPTPHRLWALTIIILLSWVDLWTSALAMTLDWVVQVSRLVVSFYNALLNLVVI